MFKPKKIICLIKTDRFKYTCKNIHLDEQKHEINNTYRFNKGVPYLIKNKEDYDELIAIDMFEPYEEKKETAKEKKAREKAEKEAEEGKKLEDSEEDNDLKDEPEAVPAEQTDGADSITKRPDAE